jgi:hypothetical protein
VSQGKAASGLKVEGWLGSCGMARLASLVHCMSASLQWVTKLWCRVGVERRRGCSDAHWAEKMKILGSRLPLSDGCRL